MEVSGRILLIKGGPGCFSLDVDCGGLLATKLAEH
jgi:hypothetical protein